MRKFARAFEEPERWRIAVQILCAQGGKTATMLGVVGERLDNRPVPIGYIGPTSDFFRVQFEPRFCEMVESCPSLSAKTPGGPKGRGQSNQMKRIAGVRVRFAHAGSSSALKSDSFGLMMVDEFDEIARQGVRDQGGALGLVEARGDTYADAQTGVISTPSVGLAEIVRDEKSGLEFWAEADQENLGSPIWELWQTGTRHHWCWPCPHCGEYFVPRLKQLRYPPQATPSAALRDSWLECPNCSGKIYERHKAACNARGEYVAPGQTISKNGVVRGTPERDTRTLSLWCSGLCSPFKTFGERAERLLAAKQSGKQRDIQSVVNSQFGELYVHTAAGLLDKEHIAGLARPFESKVPEEVIHLVAGVDVQKNRLVYVIRGFGYLGTSWLIEHGQIWGETKDEEVWKRLDEKLRAPIEGRFIKIAFIDSGFRPGKPVTIPINRVYAFCRRRKNFAFATKGSSNPMTKPMMDSLPDLDKSTGKAKAYGLRVVRLDSDFWKSRVHERLFLEDDTPGKMFLNSEIDDDYCGQLVSEAKVYTETGKWKWIKRSPDNHFLDCEALAQAAAYRLGSDDIKARGRPKPRAKPDPAAPAPKGEEPPPAPPAPAAPPSPDTAVQVAVAAQRAPSSDIRQRALSWAHRLNHR